MRIALFDAERPVGVAAFGHALPPGRRGNHDPVFSERADPRFAELFHGYGTRPVLAPEASLSELMSDASSAAMQKDALDPEQVTLLTGYASVSEYLAPNELFAVHRRLGLPSDAQVLPLADEFTVFLSGVRVAAERALAFPAERAVVACGCRWTRNVDYRDAVSVSIGDGAGAAVVRRLPERSGSAWRLAAFGTEVPAGMYGMMRHAPRRQGQPTTLHDPDADTRALFTMLPESEATFRQWGVSALPLLAGELLQRAGVRAAETSVAAHQASAHLLDAWKGALGEAQFIDTLPELGNLTLATLPVTCSVREANVETPYLLLLGLGLGIHATACLFARW